MSDVARIRYLFDLPDGSTRMVEFAFEPEDFRMRAPESARTTPPEWTELGFCRCVNCPLDERKVTHCPVALRMAPVVEELKALVSFDTLGVTVMEAERTIYVQTSAQQAMSSVLGLIMATGGCPWTDHLRPMARFHLPFASESETMYRTICMYLIARELRAADHLQDFRALEDLYRNLHLVNRDMSRRLGAATRTDPARNAMALLDSYTTSLPDAIERSLAELEPLFDAWKNRINSAI